MQHGNIEKLGLKQFTFLLILYAEISLFTNFREYLLHAFFSILL